MGRTRFEPARDVDHVTAARFLAPRVDRLAAETADAARRHAPDGVEWLSMRDERVRDTHVHADGQVVPDNLRFKVKRPDVGNDIGDERSGFELARAPRDPALSIGNRIQCRCVAVPLPGIIARAITTGGLQVSGTQASRVVECRFPRVVESEFPEPPDQGGHWLAAALADVAATSGGGAHRT